MALTETLKANALGKIDGANTRVEMVPGGKNVDGTFVANVPKAPTPLPPPAYTAPNTISAPALASTTPLKDAPPAPMTDFKAFVNSLASDTTDLTAKRGTLRDNITTTYDTLGTRGERQTAIESDLGLPDSRKNLHELNLQIAQLKKEFDSAIVNEEGVARPVEFITGRQDFLTKKRATEIGALTSIAQAMQGNIALAEKTAKDTVDREFIDEETDLKRLEFEYNANKDDLEKKDKKSADQLALFITERSRVLGEQKAERNAILAFAQQAALYGAPNDVISDIITNATTQEEAFEIGKFYMRPPAKIETSGPGVKLSATEQKEVRERIVGGEEVVGLLQQYKTLVDTHGFETGMTGKSAKVLGQYDALRGRITTALKKAETLGTLDAGVTQLVTQLIGEPLEGGVVPLVGKPGNYGGRRTARISSALETQIQLINSNIARDQSLLVNGFGASSGLGDLFAPDDLAEVGALFGTETNTSTAPFNPANFY